MIVKAKHRFFHYSVFRLFYAEWKIKKHFHEVHLLGSFQEKNLPVFILSNHVSWWDGIWVMYFNIKLLNRKFHFMMLDEQIKKQKLCNTVGGYSVKKKSKSILESLHYTIELLSDKKNMVLLFPQGKIQSLYTQDIHFEKGIDHILKRVAGKVQVIFIANLVDYFSDTKPSLYMYFQEYNNLSFEPGKAQKEYNLFYAKCVAENQQKLDA
jgi:1-acyl-sn-glycerol-3-phosphate acyltransferase